MAAVGGHDAVQAETGAAAIVEPMSSRDSAAYRLILFCATSGRRGSWLACASRGARSRAQHQLGLQQRSQLRVTAQDLLEEPWAIARGQAFSEVGVKPGSR